MTRAVRILLLACVSLLTLAFASSAFAAFRPTLAIGHAPANLGSTGPTSIEVEVPRDDDALFRAQIFVPVGYTANLGQAVGTQVGTVSAQVQVREPIAGAVLPVEGQIQVADRATFATQSAQCRQTTAPSAATWVLILQASGTELRVPAFVDPVSGPLSAIASYVINVCLPSPHIPQSAGGATFGAKLIFARLRTDGVFTAPTARGTYRWHLVATPWPNGPGLPNAAGTVNAQGRVMLPARVTLRATSRRRVLTVRGRVVEHDTGAVRQNVTVTIGRRSFRVRTNASGAFTVRVRYRRPTRVNVVATASVPKRTLTTCATPSPFPGVTCINESLQFFTASRTIRARVR